MFNQLKTVEWERRIYRSHLDFKGKTDIFLLHRLFLQFCWQYPFYGATFFDAALTKLTRRVMRAPQDTLIRVGVSSDWFCIVFADSNQLKLALPWSEVSQNLDEK